ncbi:MAG: Recombination protein RecR [Alphaproteobacteria bacterium MarineAlpha5_Bin5]|nr:MAG: Recombination protein RecR [Alphaproteobacteria bacterium MarineAlpha5_Bin5]PPR52449.1 MAG: Recombination protein RecR [Alphaproteobacteria bacterium MarineAlpha5_Bin4]|tara:strand:- start:862 stop:1461 length:600 start_codon:yes stop_codon:yes gene_type:complete
MEGSAIEKLISDISKLPGLGRRSAQRIALYLLKNKNRSLLPLIQTLQESHNKISECLSCGNVDMINPCNICSNQKRDQSSICIVEDISDLWTFERVGFYRGLYHVLGGSLSAINGIGTEDLTIKKLFSRIDIGKVKEVILALSTTMEGQTTSHVIIDKLEVYKNLTVTRLAQGIPIGGEVHYLDENTLNAAFHSRKKII